jgi:hypothetical protein
VGRVAFSPAAGLLASASDEGAIALWRLEPQPSRPPSPAPTALARAQQHGSGGGAPPPEPPRAALAAAIDAERALRSLGRELALGPRAPQQPSRRAGAGSAPGPAVPRGAGGWPSCTCSLAFSPDGAVLATAHDSGDVALWSTATGALLALLQGHAALAHGLVFSPCFTPEDGDDEQPQPFGGEGQRRPPGLLASCSDEGSVCVWRWQEADGRGLQAASRHGDHVYGADVSPDGARVASISRDGTLAVWDGLTGELRCVRPWSCGELQRPAERLARRAAARSACTLAGLG